MAKEKIAFETEHGWVSVSLHEKALDSLSRRFGLTKADFEFVNMWKNEFIDALLYNVTAQNSPHYKSSVCYLRS